MASVPSKDGVEWTPPSTLTPAWSPWRQRTHRISSVPGVAQLVGTRGVVAIDDVLHAEHGKDIGRGRARVNGQPQPLPGLVCRTLHGDPPEVRHGRVDLIEIRVDVAYRRGGVQVVERTIVLEQMRVAVDQQHRPGEIER